MCQKKGSRADRKLPIVAEQNPVPFRNQGDLIKIADMALLFRMFIVVEFMLEMQDGDVAERIDIAAGEIAEFCLFHTFSIPNDRLLLVLFQNSEIL